MNSTNSKTLGATRGFFNAMNTTKTNHSTSANGPLARAKDAIRIPDAWHRMGLPGTPGKSCKSPLREDRSASFSVYDNDRRYKDHANGSAGDVVDFVATALNVSPTEAARRVIGWAGTGQSSPAMSVPMPSKPRLAPVVAFPAQPQMPVLETPTFAEVIAIQNQRQLPMNAGIEIAINRALLFTANVYDNGQYHRAWVVTDYSRMNAQARRLDGKLWEKNNSKAKTLPGMKAGWPIGATSMGAFRNIILTEGPPDMLAAITTAWRIKDGALGDIGFACVAGAANELHPESLPHFAGKHVRIVYHQDKAGIRAAKRWAAQLMKAGATVDCFNLAGISKADGTPAKDMNDACDFSRDDGINEPLFPDGVDDLLSGLPAQSKCEVAA